MSFENLLKLLRVRKIGFEERKEFVNILFIILLALLTISFVISVKKEFDCDEFEAIHTAWKVINGKRLYIDFFQNHNPLFYYLLAPILRFFGAQIKTFYALRVLEYTFFVGIVFLTYAIGKIEFDEYTGLIAGIFSIPVLLVTRGIEIRPDVPMLFFELMSLYLLLLYFSKRKGVYLFLGAITLGLSFMILQKSIVYIIIIYIYISYELLRKRISLKELFLFSVFFVSLLATFYIWLFVNGMLSQYYHYCIVVNKGWLVAKHYNLQFLTRFLDLLGIQYYFIVFFIVGAIIYLRNTYVPSCFAIILFISTIVSKYKWPQYYLPAIPFFSLVVGFSFKNMIKNARVRSVLLGLLIFYPLLIITTNAVFKPVSMRKRNLIRVRYIMENTDPDDVVYDPFLLFNVFFKNDVGFYWMFNGNDLKTNYFRDVFYFIKTKKPKVITLSGTRIEPNNMLIRKYYTKSSKYRIYFIKCHYLINSIVIKHWLRTCDMNCISLIDTISPSSMDFETIKMVGERFFTDKDYDRAIYWFKHALMKKPIDKTCIEGLINALQNKERSDEVLKLKKDLEQLKQLIVGPYVFEKGNTFEAALINGRDFKKGETIKAILYLNILNNSELNIDHTAFISFEKDGNFYFGKDFSLEKVVRYAEIYKMYGSIKIPDKLPSGTYKVFFSFRSPLTDYRYKLINDDKVDKIFLKTVKIADLYSGPRK